MSCVVLRVGFAVDPRLASQKFHEIDTNGGTENIKHIAEHLHKSQCDESCLSIGERVGSFATCVLVGLLHAFLLRWKWG
eukprot:COSAG02_NODE_1281_length_13472_cov_8.763048_13_plen_79_part_00